MQERRIPLPWAVRWRRMRYHMFPVLLFALAIASCGWLWQQRGAAVQSVGEVDATRIDVNSPTAGLVVALPHEGRGQWSVYDYVRAGEVIARFDDKQLQLERNLIHHGVEKLLAELKQLRPTAAPDDEALAEDAAPSVWDQEQRRLHALEELLLTGVAPSGAEMAVVPVSVETATAGDASDSDELTRLRSSRRELELRAQGLALQSEMLEVRAPISGTLVAVYCWPGQTVEEGGRIATIAADHGRHIVSFLPEHSPLMPETGSPVTLRPRTPGAKPLLTEVEQVGRQIRRVPAHQLQVPGMPQWGLPVRIKLPDEPHLLPGTAVDVVFHAPR